METRAAKTKAEDLSASIGDLEDICRSFNSDELSLDSLKRLVEDRPELVTSQFHLKDSFFLLGACQNKLITLEVIQYLLKTFPGAAAVAMDETEDMTGEYPAQAIHMACMNTNCPDEVLIELINVAPEALHNFAIIYEGLTNLGEDYKEGMWQGPDEIPGLPVHYYLQRESKCSLDVLKKMIAVFPEGISSSPPAEIDIRYEGVNPIHVLLSNPNVCGMMDILQHLIETHPSVFRETSGKCKTSPLHVAIQNKSINISIIQLLINAWPESLQLRCWDCWEAVPTDLPIHVLCGSSTEDYDDASMMGKILELIISEYPTLAQAPDRYGNLPLHLAANSQSTEVCKALVESYPGSVRIATIGTPYSYAGSLPIHIAVDGGVDCIETVQFLIEYSPESLHVHDSLGGTPLHLAISQNDTTEIIKLILAQDPTVASVRSTTGLLELPLHKACGIIPRPGMDEEDILSAVELLFNAYPEAIFKKTSIDNGWDEVVPGKTPLEIACQSIRNQHRNGTEVDGNAITSFLEDQLDYARMAKDHEVMTKSDKKGRLALHLALLEGAPHGSIKCLLKGNLAALQVADNRGKLPLHLACEYGSVDTVKLFVDSSSDEVLDVQDGNMNYPLHLACLGKDYKVVQFLLKKSTSVVSKLNGDGKLPLYLLCEEVDNDYETDDEESDSEEEKNEDEKSGSDKEYRTDNSNYNPEEGDRERDSESEYSEDIECVETMMMLLLANPEIVSSFTPLLPETELVSGSVSKRARMS